MYDRPHPAGPSNRAKSPNESVRRPLTIRLRRNLQWTLGIAICGLACADASADTHAPPWPEGFSIVTIRGGHTYKVLKWGPITGQGGKRLGMGILYAAKSTELTALKLAAADLFAYVVPETVAAT